MPLSYFWLEDDMLWGTDWENLWRVQGGAPTRLSRDGHSFESAVLVPDEAVIHWFERHPEGHEATLWTASLDGPPRHVGTGAITSIGTAPGGLVVAAFMEGRTYDAIVIFGSPSAAV